MANTGKKHYSKQVSRSGRLERNNFITEDSMMRKGTAMRNQISLYWQKRKEEKKKFLHRSTETTIK